jgi:NADH-quinone oxidoreductase subunit F
MARVLGRMEAGRGRVEDIDLMREVGNNMLFRAFCALADGAVSPIDSSIRFFREEYEDHVRLGRCPFADRPAEPAITPPSAEPPPVRFDDLRSGRAPVELGEVLG